MVMVITHRTGESIPRITIRDLTGPAEASGSSSNPSPASAQSLSNQVPPALERLGSDIESVRSTRVVGNGEHPTLVLNVARNVTSPLGVEGKF